MISIETLGDLKQHGMTLIGNCAGPNCGHGRPLDIDMLIDRLGADYVFVNDRLIGSNLVCSRRRIANAPRCDTYCDTNCVTEIAPTHLSRCVH